MLNCRYWKFEFPISVNRMIYPYRKIKLICQYRKFEFPISVIRISDIGKCDDLPISEIDLPILEIRITDIGKCSINVDLTPHTYEDFRNNYDCIL